MARWVAVLCPWARSLLLCTFVGLVCPLGSRAMPVVLFARGVARGCPCMPVGPVGGVTCRSAVLPTALLPCRRLVLPCGAFYLTCRSSFGPFGPVFALLRVLLTLRHPNRARAREGSNITGPILAQKGTKWVNSGKSTPFGPLLGPIWTGYPRPLRDEVRVISAQRTS